MPAQYYIHNIYTNKDMSTVFGDAQIKRQLQFQRQQVADIASSIRDSYKDLFGDTRAYDQAVQELEKNLPLLASQAVQELPTMNISKIRQALGAQNVSQQVRLDMLKKAVAQVKQDIKEYEEVYNKIRKAHAGDLNSPRWFKKTDILELRKLRDRIRKGKDRLKELNKEALESGRAWGITQGISTALTTVAGKIAEYAEVEVLNKGFAGTGIEFSQVGERKLDSSGYDTSTEDISAHIHGVNGTLEVKLPGITLKRTGTGKDENATIDIHLKSSTVGKLINLSGMGAGGFDLETFYNAYANHNRIALNFETQSYEKNEIKNMQQMYKAFRMACLATALTGSMNSSDFGYYLVVNDQVFTAVQVIQSVLEGNGKMHNAIMPSLKDLDLDKFLTAKGNKSIDASQRFIAEYHTRIFKQRYLNPRIEDMAEAEARSNEIVALINSINTSLNLQISLQKLKQTKI